MPLRQPPPLSLLLHLRDAGCAGLKVDAAGGLDGRNGTANKLVRAIGIEPQEELASARSPEELTVLVRHSARQGVLPEETGELVRRSFAFGARRGHDAMTPRTRVVAVAPDQSVQKMLDFAAATGHSRFPVMEPGSHEVCGIVHIRRRSCRSFRVSRGPRGRRNHG